MPRGSSLIQGNKLLPCAPKSQKFQNDFTSSKTLKEFCKREWHLGSVIGQGGFGLIYLGVILPMYVLLKLMELGPCDVSFFFGSVSAGLFITSTCFSLWYFQNVAVMNRACQMFTFLSFCGWVLRTSSTEKTRVIHLS